MLISINERDPRPIYMQIARQIKEQIQTEELHRGDELPSVRELAESLGINLHTVRRGYQELSDAGLLSVRLGRRARVLRSTPSGRIPDEIRASFVDRVRELLVDGLLVGFSADELRELVGREIKELAAPRSRPIDTEE